MHLLCHDDAVKRERSQTEIQSGPDKQCSQDGWLMRGFFLFVFIVFQIFYEMLMLFWEQNEMLVGCLVTKSCPTLVTPWTVAHQAPLSPGFPRPRILGWVATSFSRGSSRPRDQTCVSCTAGRFFTAELPRKPHKMKHTLKQKSKFIQLLKYLNQVKTRQTSS